MQPRSREPAASPPVPSPRAFLALAAVAVAAVVVVGLAGWSPLIALAVIAAAIWGYLAVRAIGIVRERKQRERDRSRPSAIPQPPTESERPQRDLVTVQFESGLEVRGPREALRGTVLIKDEALVQPHRPTHREQAARRDAEISELLSYGLSSREIAGRLALSVSTVEAHVARIRSSGSDLLIEDVAPTPREDG